MKKMKKGTGLALMGLLVLSIIAELILVDYGSLLSSKNLGKYCVILGAILIIRVLYLSIKQEKNQQENQGDENK